jgi:hypothetical protein
METEIKLPEEEPKSNPVEVGIHADRAYVPRRPALRRPVGVLVGGS